MFMTWSRRTPSKGTARVLLLLALTAVVCLPVFAQDDPNVIIKNIEKMIADGKGAEAKTQYCVATAPPRVQKYCANAIDSNIKQFEDAERSQMPQGKALFNAGDYVKSKNLFNNIKSSSLQADKGKWLGYIDKMEKGKAAAQATPPRIGEIKSTLVSIKDSPDTEIKDGARGAASQLIDGAFNQIIGTAQSKANGASKDDLAAANAALADAKQLKPLDPKINQVQTAINALDAKVNPKNVPPAPNPNPAPPTPPRNNTVTTNNPAQVKTLETAINAYYNRQYDTAVKQLDDFLNSAPQVTPKVEALAYFFRGAAKMSAKALAGQASPESAAMDDFRQAKQKNLNPPSQQYVAPRILAAFNRA